MKWSAEQQSARSSRSLPTRCLHCLIDFPLTPSSTSPADDACWLLLCFLHHHSKLAQHLSHTMSATPTTTTTAAASTTAPPAKELPQLLPLEEDDEFEEFPAEGQSIAPTLSLPCPSFSRADADERNGVTDWDDKDTFAKSLDKSTTAGSKDASAPKGLDSLWEDNWDDDDVGDDFSVQLR